MIFFFFLWKKVNCNITINSSLPISIFKIQDSVFINIILMAFIADFTFNTYFFPFPQFTNHELTLKYFYCTIEFTRNIGFYRKYDHYVKHFLTKISSSIKLHLCVSKNHHRETVLNCNIAFVIHCRFAWFFLVFLIVFSFYTIKTLFYKKWNMYKFACLQNIRILLNHSLICYILLLLCF